MNDKQAFLKRMKEYFSASIQLDLHMLENIYASEFESVRTDFKGHFIRMSRERLLHKVFQLKEKEMSLPFPDQIDLLGICRDEDNYSLIYRVVKGENEAIHQYVWKRKNNQCLMVRQFVVESDLTLLQKG